jgi:hypothetical protein
MIALERDNLDLMLAGQGRAHSIANTDQAQAWATRKGLLADQAEAVKVTLAAADWLTAIEGRAGSTKEHNGRSNSRICRRAGLCGVRLRADHPRR